MSLNMLEHIIIYVIFIHRTLTYFHRYASHTVNNFVKSKIRIVVVDKGIYIYHDTILTTNVGI